MSLIYTPRFEAALLHHAHTCLTTAYQHLNTYLQTRPTLHTTRAHQLQQAQSWLQDAEDVLNPGPVIAELIEKLGDGAERDGQREVLRRDVGAARRGVAWLEVAGEEGEGLECVRFWCAQVEGRLGALAVRGAGV